MLSDEELYKIAKGVELPPVPDDIMDALKMIESNEVLIRRAIAKAQEAATLGEIGEWIESRIDKSPHWVHENYLDVLMAAEEIEIIKSGKVTETG